MIQNLFNEKKCLQSAVAVASFVPIIAGLSGVLQGTGMVEFAPDVSLNSHVKYLSGLLLAIGLAFLYCIPSIETKKSLFSALTFIVVIGGLAQLLAYITDGSPETPMLFGLCMELCVTPILCFWQWSLACKYGMDR